MLRFLHWALFEQASVVKMAALAGCFGIVSALGIALALAAIDEGKDL